MATYFWKSLNDGQVIAFNPAADVLRVDNNSISAADVGIDLLSWGTTGNLTLSYLAPDADEDQTVTLLSTNPRSLTPTNITFSDGSKLLIGDKALGTANDDHANILTGGLEDDQLLGLGGADSLSGSDGEDKIEGGLGNDTLLGGAGDDFLSDIDSQVVGIELVGGGNDSFVGGAGADFILDFWGNNTLNGGADGDLFVAAAITGGSRVTGGSGQDIYFLGTLSPSTYYESLDFDVGAGGDFLHIGALLSISAQSGFYQGGNPFTQGFVQFLALGPDTLVQFDDDGPGGPAVYTTRITLKNVAPASVSKTENVTGFVTGGSGDDNLVGGTGDQAIFAAAGSDTLNGGAGADSMHGGTGRDRYLVDDRDDIVIENSNASAVGLGDDGSDSGPNALDDFIDTVVAAVTYSLEDVAFVENLTLSSAAVDATGNPLANVLKGNGLSNTLVGLDGNDTLDGAGGRDKLQGGTGSDVLVGGAGKDTLTGSAGADMYDFNTALNASTNVDTITAYSLAGDLMRLDNDIFMGLASGTLAGSQYYEAAAATAANDASDRIIYNTANGKLYFDADGSGNGDSVLFAILSGAPNIGAADFLIVN